MKKIIIVLLLFSVGAASISAQSKVSRWITGDLAWYPAHLQGYGIENFAPISYNTVPLPELEDMENSDIEDEGRDIGGQAFEVRATLIQEIEFPFLQGASPLTSQNNVKIRIKGEVSPVTIGAEVETVFSPIAFFSLDSSLSAGSGWSLIGINGLAYNTPEKTYEPAPFEGTVLETEIGATLQFDFGVLVPGDWTHIVTVYRPSVKYEAFTAAEPDEAWQWQADGGENYNGWSWNQTGVLGYLLPAVDHVDTAGLLLETEQRITRKDVSTMDSGGWGSDFMTVYVSPFVVVRINSHNSLTVQGQFARSRDYTDETIGNAHFSYREVDADSPVYWYFRRIALSYRYDY